MKRGLEAKEEEPRNVKAKGEQYENNQHESDKHKLTVRGRAQKSGYESLNAPGGYLPLREGIEVALRFLVHAAQERDIKLDEVKEFTAKHFTTEADRAALAEFLAKMPNLEKLTLEYSVPYSLRAENDMGIAADCMSKLQEVTTVTNELIRVHEISILAPWFRFLGRSTTLKSLAWTCKHQGNMERYGELFALLSASESLERITLQGAQLAADFDNGLGIGLSLPSSLKHLMLPDLKLKTRSWWQGVKGDDGDEDSKCPGAKALELHADNLDEPFYFDQDADPNFEYHVDVAKFENHLRAQAKPDTASATVCVVVDASEII